MHRACLIPLFTFTLAAQVPPSGSVSDLLASNDPARLAWGAELAARNESQEFVPEIRRLLNWTDDRVKEHALDALIRLKAKVPPEELTPLPPEFKVQVIILATANQQRNILSAMLKLDEPNDATWVALNESLIRIGAGQEYWPSLLREWTIQVAVYVRDQAPSAIPGLQTIGGATCGDALSNPRPNFPTRATYGLFLDAQPGDTVLDSQPYAVYCRRQSNPSGCDKTIERDDYRGDFVEHEVHLETPLNGHVQYDVTWPNDKAYIAEMNRLRAQTLGRFQQILDWMLKRRLIPPEDVVLRPHIIVAVEDQRSKQAHQLPATEPWE